MIDLTFDIETIPTEDPQVIAEIAAGVTAAKTMTTPETIAKWESEEKPAAVDQAVRATALTGLHGRICCIGYKWDFEPAQTATGAEAEVIRFFFNEVRERINSARVPVRVIGHNITGFDLRFLWQRAVVNCIKPLAALPWTEKPWSERIMDTMLMWDADKTRRVSLDNLCRALSIPTSKDKMTGAQVADYWRAGKINEIAEYCRKDVEATRAVFNRMTMSDPAKTFHARKLAEAAAASERG